MRKIITVIFILLVSLPVLAQQQRGMRWGGGIDYEKFHWGFSFHYVASSLKVFKDADWQNPDLLINKQEDDAGEPLGTLSNISSPISHGVGVGLLADLKLGEHTHLRFNPNVLFAGKQMNFVYPNSITEKEVIASLLELPLTFKFKSDRRKNYGVYVLGGGKYSRNIASKKRLNDSEKPEPEKLVKLQPGYFSYELGLGVDIYFEYFKMSPEIKWSQSIGNVLDKSDPNAFNTPIDKLLLRSVQFSLIFE